MDTPLFWQLIEGARKESGSDCEEQAAILEERLSALSSEEIVAFDRLFRDYHRLAYRWDLWGAAYIMNGGCSDDGFDYFRSWLIGQGQTIYERALENPDSLAEADVDVESEAECEALLYVALNAYETKTGGEIPMQPSPVLELIGERWEEDDLYTLYPALIARYEQESTE